MTCPFKYKPRGKIRADLKNKYKDRKNKYIKGKRYLLNNRYIPAKRWNVVFTELEFSRCCLLYTKYCTLSAERGSAQWCSKGTKGLWSLFKAISYISMHDVCRSSILCLSGIAERETHFLWSTKQILLGNGLAWYQALEQCDT